MAHSRVERVRARPDGEPARLMLAFLGSAGIYYVNIMPALVDGLIVGAGFTNRQAGLVGSANVYGAALGALLAVFLVARIRWRPTACALLLGLLCLDGLSIGVPRFEPLLALRFAHGTLGGMLTGVAFSIIARTAQADRGFGYLLLVQFGLGGLGMMLLPPMVPGHGIWVLYAALMLFSLVTVVTLPFLDDYPVSAVAKPATAARGNHFGLLALSLLGIFLFQAGNMAVFAYVIGIGEAAGLGLAFISPVLALAAWIGIAGSGVVIILSTRHGRRLPLGAAILLTAAANCALHRSDIALVYLVANALVGFAWAIGVPYLLGICAGFDRTGQMAALGGFASKMGLASGPLVAALVVGSDRYGRVIDLGVIALLLCLAVAFRPARELDRAS